MVYGFLYSLTSVNHDISGSISYIISGMVTLYFLNKKYPLDFSFKINIKLVSKYVLPALFISLIFNFPHHAWLSNNIPKQYALFIELNIAEKIFYLFNLCFLSPTIEEVLFRGFIYRILKNRYNIFWGVLVSTLFFHFIHFEPFYFLFIILSLIFTYVYEKTGTIWGSIMTHSLHNAFWFMFVYWGVNRTLF